MSTPNYLSNFQNLAPLINLPVISTIISKLATDIVGPLKTSQSGNRFILTVIDFTSHYPLAYSLKSHTAMGVVRYLVEVNTGFLTRYFLTVEQSSSVK